jgi:hypothetical protein
MLVNSRDLWRQTTIKTTRHGSFRHTVTRAAAGLGLCVALGSSPRAAPGIVLPPPEVGSGPTLNPASGHVYYLLTQGNWSASEAKAEERAVHWAGEWERRFHTA